MTAPIEALTTRLREQLAAVEETINSGGRDDFDPRELPFVLIDAIALIDAQAAEIALSMTEIGKLRAEVESARASENEACAKWHDERAETFKTMAREYHDERNSSASDSCLQNMVAHQVSAAAIRARLGVK